MSPITMFSHWEDTLCGSTESGFALMPRLSVSGETSLPPPQAASESASAASDAESKPFLFRIFIPISPNFKRTFYVDLC